jgi:hypothetical protein
MVKAWKPLLKQGRCNRRRLSRLGTRVRRCRRRCRHARSGGWRLSSVWTVRIATRFFSSACIASLTPAHRTRRLPASKRTGGHLEAGSGIRQNKDFDDRRLADVGCGNIPILTQRHRRPGRQAIRPDVKRHGSLPGARTGGLAHNACLGVWADAWIVAPNIAANDSSSASRCSVPTSINDSKGNPLFLTSSSESANGTVSSARLCRMTVPRLHRRRRAPGLPRRAEQDQRRGPGVDVHGHGPATAGADHNIRLALVELGLGDADGGIEVVVGQGRVQDGRGRGPSGRSASSRPVSIASRGGRGFSWVTSPETTRSPAIVAKQ